MYGNKVYKKLLGELISTKATLREGQDTTQLTHRLIMENNFDSIHAWESSFN